MAFFISFVVQHRVSCASRTPKWDWLAVSAAEVGVAFVTVMLVTGPIWAHPVWGIWWTWDARLTSTFVLWVLYVCYLLLRTLIDEPERRAVVSAVFGIFAAFDIPLVYFSIWFFRTQHPQPVIGDGGSLDPRMLDVLLLCWAATAGACGAVAARSAIVWKLCVTKLSACAGNQTRTERGEATFSEAKK